MRDRNGRAQERGLSQMDEGGASKSDRTRRRILEAAASVFRQEGYTSASLREIAETADLQAGSLYYYFAGKEALAEAVMDEGVGEARRRAERAVAALGETANAIDRIEAAFRGHLEVLLEEADFAVATLRMLHQTPEAVRKRHLRRQRAFGRFYADLFQEARDTGMIREEFDLSALRMLLIGALNWSPEWFDDDKLSAEELVAQLSLLMRRGLVPANVRMLPKRRRASRSG